jgi:2-keto-3-deoxy-galactonokinase
VINPLAFIIAGLVASVAGLIVIPVASHPIGLALILVGAVITSIGRRQQRRL